MASGRAPAAAKLYRALLDAEADAKAEVLPMLGEALVRSGDMEGGIRAYREALDVLPSNGAVRGKLALLYSATGQLAAAVDAYRILFEQGQVAEFGPPLAEVLIRSQRDEDAAAVLERVLQVAPESTAALALRGKQLFGQGRHRAAAVHFERLRRLWPQDYRVYFYLAKLYDHLGEDTKADDAHALYIRYRRHKERRRHAGAHAASRRNDGGEVAIPSGAEIVRRPVLMLLALAGPLGLSAANSQEVRFGQGGNITWEGEVSGLQGVSTIQPEFRPSLNPNTTAIGVAPDDQIELAHSDYPGAILPIQLDEGENLSASLVAEGGSIVSETAVEINNDELTAILQGAPFSRTNGHGFRAQGHQYPRHSADRGPRDHRRRQPRPLLSAQHLPPLADHAVSERLSEEL